jgi:hypothetical protein
MAGQVYFGTADKQTWIKAPATGMKASSNSWGTRSQLLDGRAYVRRSNQSHRQYDATWVGSLNDSDLSTSLQTIKNFADGLYGDGPFYFVDPFAADQNVMPPHWAAPMLAEKGWLTLTEDIDPTFTAAAINNQFPVKYASYVTTDDFISEDKITLIIPTGYKLAFGWHGPSAGSSTGIRIVPYKRADGLADTAINPTKITAGGTVRTNTIVSGTTYSRVEIFLATTTASTVNITAMIAQIIPTTASVAAGGFIAGKGTTGLDFAASPTIDYYSSAINNGQIGMSATWVEV